MSNNKHTLVFCDSGSGGDGWQQQQSSQPPTTPLPPPWPLLPRTTTSSWTPMSSQRTAAVTRAAAIAAALATSEVETAAVRPLPPPSRRRRLSMKSSLSSSSSFSSSSSSLSTTPSFSTPQSRMDKKLYHDRIITHRDKHGFAKDLLSPFIKHMYMMVDDPSTDAAIGWDDAGTSFIIHDVKKFEHVVVKDNCFRTSSYASIHRQFNLYRFVSLAGRSSKKHCWCHPCFVRSDRDLTARMRKQRNKDYVVLADGTTSSMEDVRSMMRAKLTPAMREALCLEPLQPKQTTTSPPMIPASLSLTRTQQMQTCDSFAANSRKSYNNNYSDYSFKRNTGSSNAAVNAATRSVKKRRFEYSGGGGNNNDHRHSRGNLPDTSSTLSTYNTRSRQKRLTAAMPPSVRQRPSPQLQSQALLKSPAFPTAAKSPGLQLLSEQATTSPRAQRYTLPPAPLPVTINGKLRYISPILSSPSPALSSLTSKSSSQSLIPTSSLASSSTSSTSMPQLASSTSVLPPSTSAHLVSSMSLPLKQAIRSADLMHVLSQQSSLSAALDAYMQRRHHEQQLPPNLQLHQHHNTNVSVGVDVDAGLVELLRQYRVQHDMLARICPSHMLCNPSSAVLALTSPSTSEASPPMVESASASASTSTAATAAATAATSSSASLSQTTRTRKTAATTSTIASLTTRSLISFSSSADSSPSSSIESYTSLNPPSSPMQPSFASLMAAVSSSTPSSSLLSTTSCSSSLSLPLTSPTSTLPLQLSSKEEEAAAVMSSPSITSAPTAAVAAAASAAAAAMSANTSRFMSSVPPTNVRMTSAMTASTSMPTETAALSSRTNGIGEHVCQATLRQSRVSSGSIRSSSSRRSDNTDYMNNESHSVHMSMSSPRMFVCSPVTESYSVALSPSSQSMMLLTPSLTPN